MSLLCFILCFTMMTKMELVQENSIQIEPYHPQAIQEEIKPEEPQANYYANCRITFYCPCSACCGSWGNATASGVMPTANHTVANGSLPFGTRIKVDGQEYIVEDRGVGEFEIDIFVNDHQEALNRGLYYSDVYIVE